METNDICFDVQGILLDIEGTTSSISFVYDAMFPYIREHLHDYLESHWRDEAIIELVPLLENDAQGAGISNNRINSVEQAEQIVIALMDGDHKATGLKKLQGFIWKNGFQSGALISHVYDDVVPAIENWNAKGCDVRIYSSGSVQAQQLFFGHTAFGNLLHHFTAHYDTVIGPKKDPSSYQTIASEFALPPEQILFISDVTAELQAAKAAGLKTVLSCRPGNPGQPDSDQFPAIESFAQVSLQNQNA